MKRWIVLMFVLVAGACGPSLQHGASRSRGALEVNGRSFFLRHSQPERGGRITGQVCGMDLELRVEPGDEGTWVRGFLDGRLPVELVVHSHEGGERVILGSLGRGLRESRVELHLGAAGLTGQVGLRRFDLHAAEDILRGELSYQTTLSGVARTGPAVREQTTEAEVRGRGLLMELPPAVQAALVPTLLTCNGIGIEMRQRGPLVLGIGGKIGYEPPRTSSLYTF